MKYHPHGSVLFVTFSIEQGLLLLCNPLCEAIIKSNLARSQFLHPVKIVAFLIEATHVHMVLVVQNPDDVSGFVKCFKTETAHAINRLLGRKKRTVWCEGYDSPVVLTPLRTLMVLTYLYSNPAKDNLESSIDRYPGVSSWEMFLNKEYVRHWKRIRRPAYRRLAPDAHSLRGYRKEAGRILSDTRKTHEFVLSPDAWLDAFKITDEAQRKSYNQKIIDRVRTIEARAEKKRMLQKKKVLGAAALQNQTFNTTRLPDRVGRRTWCLSESRDRRIRFIQFLKSLIAEARAIRERWKFGDYSLPYPLGLYPPSQPKLAEPLTVW